MLALLAVFRDTEGVGTTGPRPVHVHGLGVNPADGALFIATHAGMWRLDRDDDRALRVGESYQDTMGFTVVGPDRFLGSGHPDLRTDLPPLLGLIESADAGASWTPMSLLGEADFHVLRYADGRLYGYDATNDRLLASEDRGRTWEQLETPGPILDLAVHPRNATRVVALSGGRLHESRDGGDSWRSIGTTVGLLAWPSPDRLYLVDPNGRTFVSADEGVRFEPVGTTASEPAALMAIGEEELYVAAHDGTIRHSTDGGSTWRVRATP